MNFGMYRFPYRGRRRMLKALGSDLGREVIWTASDVAPDGELADIVASTPNIHKWLHYLPVYESALPADRSQPIRMLEIGVARGGSLQMWRRYLPEATIVGVDIDPSCKQFDDPSQRVHVRIGSQTDTGFLQRVIDEFGTFDVVVDDGSHMTSHMVRTFQYLFPNGLGSGGAYIVEDIAANYWRNFRDSPMSFVEFTKWLIDAMHAHYPAARKMEVDFRVGDSRRLGQFRVPLATTLVEKVEFYDSIAVIRRANGRRQVPVSVYK